MIKLTAEDIVQITVTTIHQVSLSYSITKSLDYSATCYEDFMSPSTRLKWWVIHMRNWIAIFLGNHDNKCTKMLAKSLLSNTDYAIISFCTLAEFLPSQVLHLIFFNKSAVLAKCLYKLSILHALLVFKPPSYRIF